MVRKLRSCLRGAVLISSGTSGCYEMTRPDSVISMDDGFADRFEQHRGRLLRLCARMVGGCAEDAVQTTFIRAYKSVHTFDGDNLAGWLTRVARSVCIDLLRSDARLCYLGDAHAVGGGGIHVTLDALQIRTILQKLPDEQRRCLKLFYIEGYSAGEVARITGYTEKKVRYLVERGRLNFMRHWEEKTGAADG